MYDVFDRAYGLRKKAKKFRAHCRRIDHAMKNSEIQKVDKLLNELDGLLRIFKNSEVLTTTDWTIQAGFPWGVAFGIGEKAYKARNLNFIKELFGSRSIPITLYADIKRLFNQDMQFFDVLIERFPSQQSIQAIEDKLYNKYFGNA